jgi:hypothetical protein
MTTENQALFDRWVTVPMAALRAIPDGDGAFAALSMSFGLYERFLASKIHQREGKANDDARWEEASLDFDRKVSASDFKSFWEMYRVGMQHYFHPKHFTKGIDKTRWGWDMSEGDDYKSYPIIIKKEENLFIITINPWAFSTHVIERWREFPELLNELSAMKLGVVSSPTSYSEPSSTYYHGPSPSYATGSALPVVHSSTRSPS